MINQNAALATVINRQAHRHNMKYGACMTGKNQRQLAILAVLQKLADINGKKHSFPSQETILDKLHQFHGITMSRRTLNRDLDELSDCGAIQRYRRTRPVPGQGRRYTSTAYYVVRDLVRRSVAAIRSCFRTLGLARVPNLAQNDHCLRNVNSYEEARTVPVRPQSGQFAPPGAVPDFIPG